MLDDQEPYIPSGMQRPVTRKNSTPNLVRKRRHEEPKESWKQFQQSDDNLHRCRKLDVGEVHFEYADNSSSPQKTSKDISVDDDMVRSYPLKTGKDLPVDDDSLGHLVADKLRLLKTSSRASSRSNCSRKDGSPRSDATPTTRRHTDEGFDTTLLAQLRADLHSASALQSKISPLKKRGKRKDALYTSCEELLPFSTEMDPGTRMKETIQRLQLDDWEQQFEALDDLRRIAKFNPASELVVRGGSSDKKSLPSSTEQYRFHHAFPFVVLLSDSPRSALAKNAIHCLHDLISLLPARCVESCVDISIPLLLRKSVDTNEFVCEEALRCLRQLSTNIAVQKLLPMMLVHQQAAKSAAARSKGLLFFCWILLRVGDSEEVLRYRDTPRLLTLISTSMEDANAEVRQMARLCVQCLGDISPDDGVQSDIQEVGALSDEAFRKMEQCLSRPRTKVPLW